MQLESSFTKKLGECAYIQHLFGEKRLKLGILVLHRLQTLTLDASMPPYMAIQW